MSGLRAFRFGVQEHGVASAQEWREKARRTESLGYSALYVPDHFSDQFGPIAAIVAAADATTSLRVGSLVFDNDYRHPVVLAKEAATIDVLSDGRFDFGLGAGWLTSDYRKSGIALDPVGTRIERMAEGLEIIKGLWAGGEISFQGKHYQIDALEGTPRPVLKPHPPILIGGGGRRMLSLAAREADIVNVNFNLRSGSHSAETASTGLAGATDEKVGWIRDAAGDRFDKIELSLYIYFASVTDDREYIAAAIAPNVGMEPREVLAMPNFLIGTAEQLIDDLRARRERYGTSFVIVPGAAAEAFAPVVERLAGT
jgi:probable F420-dependent oxidoreductase